MNDRTLKGLTGSMIFLCASVAHAQAPAATEATKPAADAPAAPPAEATPPAEAPKPAAAPKPPVTSKFGVEFTGVAELDLIIDSTQSLNEVPGNAAIQRDSAAGVRNPLAHRARTQMSARNSKFGFKIKGPESEDFKTSAMVEADFFGNPGATEQLILSNGPMRLRHAYMKLETPVVDVLAGQTWQLFGHVPIFIPNTVSIHGVPGEIFGRSPQLRVSRAFKSDAFNVEPALALARPPQRDSGLPDFQGGVRFTLNGQKGIHTAGQTGTSVSPLSVGVSGVVRRFMAPNPANAQADAEKAVGKGVSIDALIPILGAASTDDRSNALTLTGSFVTGSGINDLYSGLTGGAGTPTAVNGNPGNPMAVPPVPATAAVPYAGIDPGLAVSDANGKLKTVDWQSFLVGVQYYLPVAAGQVWVSANYSQLKSGNINNLPGLAGAMKKSQWFDVNLFWDASKAVRFGAEYANFSQTYGDGGKAKNNRFQTSAFYIF